MPAASLIHKLDRGGGVQLSLSWRTGAAPVTLPNRPHSRSRALCTRWRRAVPPRDHRCRARRTRARTRTLPRRPRATSCHQGATLDFMTDNETPWEPPLAGTEAEHLLGALDRLRATFRWKT